MLLFFPPKFNCVNGLDQFYADDTLRLERMNMNEKGFKTIHSLDKKNLVNQFNIIKRFFVSIFLFLC
jgi:hypothetical protein